MFVPRREEWSPPLPPGDPRPMSYWCFVPAEFGALAHLADTCQILKSCVFSSLSLYSVLAAQSPAKLSGCPPVLHDSGQQLSSQVEAHGKVMEMYTFPTLLRLWRRGKPLPLVAVLCGRH